MFRCAFVLAEGRQHHYRNARGLFGGGLLGLMYRLRGLMLFSMWCGVLYAVFGSVARLLRDALGGVERRRAERLEREVSEGVAVHSIGAAALSGEGRVENGSGGSAGGAAASSAAASSAPAAGIVGASPYPAAQAPRAETQHCEGKLNEESSGRDGAIGAAAVGGAAGGGAPGSPGAPPAAAGRSSNGPAAPIAVPPLDAAGASAPAADAAAAPRGAQPSGGGAASGPHAGTSTAPDMLPSSADAVPGVSFFGEDPQALGAALARMWEGFAGSGASGSSSGSAQAGQAASLPWVTANTSGAASEAGSIAALRHALAGDATEAQAGGGDGAFQRQVPPPRPVDVWSALPVFGMVLSSVAFFSIISSL